MGKRNCYGNFYPHWNTRTNMPLIIWSPRYLGNGHKVKEFSCTCNIYAIALGDFGINHQYAPYSRPLLFAEGTCSDDRYAYFLNYDNENHSVFWYLIRLSSKVIIKGNLFEGATVGCFMPGVDVVLWRLPVEWYLVDKKPWYLDQLFYLFAQYQ